MCTFEGDSAMLPCRKHAFDLKPPGLISLFPKSQNTSRLWQRDKRKSKAEVILQHQRRVPSRPQIYPILRFHHHSSVSVTSINICSHPSAAWLQSCTCNQATAGGLCAWLIVNDRSPNKHQNAASPHRSLSGILNGAELSREWKRHRVQCGPELSSGPAADDPKVKLQMWKGHLSLWGLTCTRMISTCWRTVLKLCAVLCSAPKCKTDLWNIDVRLGLRVTNDICTGEQWVTTPALQAGAHR